MELIRSLKSSWWNGHALDNLMDAITESCERQGLFVFFEPVLCEILSATEVRMTWPITIRDVAKETQATLLPQWWAVGPQWSWMAGNADAEAIVTGRTAKLVRPSVPRFGLGWSDFPSTYSPLFADRPSPK